MYGVYVIECKTPNHYYVGETRQFKHRITSHMRGNGARFTRSHGEWKEVKNLKEDYMFHFGSSRLRTEEYFELCTARLTDLEFN
jgi:predicted GIY-YIG superfamily endonuclease